MSSISFNWAQLFARMKRNWTADLAALNPYIRFDLLALILSIIAIVLTKRQNEIMEKQSNFQLIPLLYVDLPACKAEYDSTQRKIVFSNPETGALIDTFVCEMTNAGEAIAHRLNIEFPNRIGEPVYYNYLRSGRSLLIRLPSQFDDSMRRAIVKGRTVDEVPFFAQFYNPLGNFYEMTFFIERRYNYKSKSVSFRLRPKMNK